MISKSSNELFLNTLQSFKETTGLYSSANPRVIYTDGIAYLIDKGYCPWLLEEVVWKIPQLPRKHHDTFYCVNFIACSEKSTGDIMYQDSQGNIIDRKFIPFTDFPLKDTAIKLCLSLIEDNIYCFMLATEYSSISK